MCKNYQMQIDRKRYFVHEPPATAVSWSDEDIMKIAAQQGVVISKADQCQYGLTTKGKKGQGKMPALKPTKNMPNSVPMIELLGKKMSAQTHSSTIEWE